MIATDSPRIVAPLSEAAARIVWDAVRQASRGLSPDRQHFEGLIERARAALEKDSRDDPPVGTALAAAVALSWMGPHVHQPPQDTQASLIGLAEPLGAPKIDRMLELAIAYGCGWRRSVDRNSTAWERRWDRALDALRALINRFIEDAYRRVRELNIRFPIEPDLAGAADLLLVRLYRPLSPLRLNTNDALIIYCTDTNAQVTAGAGHREAVPPGAKAVYSVHSRDNQPTRLGRPGAKTTYTVPDGATLRLTAMDFETRVTLTANASETTLKLRVGEEAQLSGPADLEIWECTCGHQRCAERHRLASWNPTLPHQTLANFIASAIKGPGRIVKTGSFTQGMLFALWSREGF